MKMFKMLGAAAAAIVLAGVAAPASAQTVKIGSKNFTEQYVLAEIYAAALENAGMKVVRKINLGGTLIAHQALTAGEIDLYPEYTGTALISVVKGKIQSDPTAVYKEVKDFYEKNFKITWLKPDAINNGYALLVRPETAATYKLKTLSDLGKAASNLVLGAGPEFSDRADGLPGLSSRSSGSSPSWACAMTRLPPSRSMSPTASPRIGRSPTASSWRWTTTRACSRPISSVSYTHLTLPTN